MAFQPFTFAFALIVGLTLSFSLFAQHQPIASGVYVWKDLPVSKKASIEQRQILEGTTPAFKHLKVHATTLKPQQAPHPSHKHSDEELASFAQQPWNGKKCAVVLTYDDALNVHLNNAIPTLDSAGFKGTFYISGSFPGFTQRLQDWRKAAQRGHELGNHTLFHPCDASLPGRQWVNPENDLSKYTLKRITEEIKVTNVLLEAIDGKKSRTFAYTCGDAKVGTQFFMDGLKGELMAARGVRGEMHPVDQIDLYYTDGYIVNNDSGEKMTSLVKKAMQTNTLLIFVFHGVGGEHSLDVSLAAHRELVHFLKQHEKDIWVAPLVDVADFLKQQKR